jgi:non-ribosomal peptide synthetase component F
MTARHNDRLGATEFPAMAADEPFAIYSGAKAATPRTLWQILETTAKAFPWASAIDDGQSVLSYRDLLSGARQAGYRLASRGIGAGDRIGIRMTTGTVERYLSILAVLSVGAAYVPVDPDDPDDHAQLAWSAAAVRAIIGDGGELTWRTGRHRRSPARRPVPEDEAWILFTSGTASTPKCLAVTHGNAAAFVDAEASLFLGDDPLAPGDRVLAGLPVAFDASCAEMWLAWRHGACLVPARREVVRTDADLLGWLGHRRVTAGVAGVAGVAAVTTAAVTGPLSPADRAPTARPAISPAPGDPARAGTRAYVARGAGRLLAFLASVFAGAAVVCAGFSWICGSVGRTDLYLPSLGAGTGTFALLCGLYSMFRRALGAKVGRR